jgi:hypothetical protein
MGAREKAVCGTVSAEAGFGKHERATIGKAPIAASIKRFIVKAPNVNRFSADSNL